MGEGSDLPGSSRPYRARRSLMLLPAPPNRPWYRELNSYHWLVLVVCTLSWSLDCLTQQIFNLTRKPAMADLLATSPGDPAVAFFGA